MLKVYEDKYYLVNIVNILNINTLYNSDDNIVIYIVYNNNSNMNINTIYYNVSILY